jgi:hypothetical protein
MTTYDDKPYYAKGQEKIIKKGDYIYAFAGDAIAGNIANFLWNPPKLIKTMPIDDFMQSKVLPSLREVMNDNGYHGATKDDKDGGFDALICLNGSIYEVDHDFLWSRDDRGLYAVGSGGSLALGALATGFSKTSIKSAEFAARRAIKISADYCISVGGDIKVISQKRNDMKKLSPAMKKKAYAMAEKAEPRKEKAKELKKGIAMMKKKKGK